MTDDGIQLTATEFKVSATEKVSTGDYENYQPHVTIEGEMPLAVTLDEEQRRELKAKLLALHKDAQEIVERAGENRIAAEGHADWGVHNGDDD